MREIFPAFARRGGCADQVPLDSGADGAVRKFHRDFLAELFNRHVRSCYVKVVKSDSPQLFHISTRYGSEL